AGDLARDGQGGAARPPRRAKPADLDRQHPEDGRRLLQGARHRHALEEALTGGRAAAAGGDGAREGAHATVAAGNRQQLRRARPYDGPARLPADRKIARVAARAQSRRQFPASGAAQLTRATWRSGARTRGTGALEARGRKRYNLWIKRPGDESAKKPPVHPHAATA